jgi:hypothetical protein
MSHRDCYLLHRLEVQLPSFGDKSWQLFSKALKLNALVSEPLGHLNHML